ncbi:SGNH/GDSL hydrolase family protein [Fibrobacter succinogenes]|uniref:SGNH/GDSL hydrolase family protein n=1 Tax=Fibrobacter succinogenes TaxID=833 RepID=UPI00156A3B2B|nr:SGNH/GDSL hydrolase family protein [Fibrobacter succinogenes]
MQKQNFLDPQISGNNNIVKLTDALGNPNYFVRSFKQGAEVLIPLADVIGYVNASTQDIKSVIPPDTSAENQLVNEKILNNIAPDFKPSVACEVGKTYWYKGNLYECVTAHTGPWVAEHFSQTSVDALFAKNFTIIDLNDISYWVNGEVKSGTGYVNPDNHTRLATKMIQFDPTAVLSFVKKEGVSFDYSIYCYDKYKRYLGHKDGKLSISEAVHDYPAAVWFRLGLIQVSGVTPVSAANIGNIAVFEKTPSKKYALMSEFSALESSDKLSGKIWYACGDSFTEGAVDDSPMPSGMYAGKKQVYPYFIGNRTGMEVHNIAVSGSTIAYIEGTSTASNCFTYPITGKLYTIPEYAEYITLKFGINDSHQNVPIGTIDDDTNATLYGAWNVAISYLLNKCPFAKIGVIVTNGCDSPEYSQVGKDIAKKWGLAYLDENFGYEVPLLHRVNGKPLVCAEAHQNRLENFRVSEVNTHPNDKAHEYESTFVEAWLRTL